MTLSCTMPGWFSVLLEESSCHLTVDEKKCYFSWLLDLDRVVFILRSSPLSSTKTLLTTSRTLPYSFPSVSNYIPPLDYKDLFFLDTPVRSAQIWISLSQAPPEELQDSSLPSLGQLLFKVVIGNNDFYIRLLLPPVGITCC